MSEEKQTAPTSMPPPQLPGRAKELFRVLFSPGPAVALSPPPAVQAKAHAYQIYVMQFVQRLDLESRHLAAISRDEGLLGQKAKDLLQAKLYRREALTPYLTTPGND